MFILSIHASNPEIVEIAKSLKIKELDEIAKINPEMVEIAKSLKIKELDEIAKIQNCRNSQTCICPGLLGRKLLNIKRLWSRWSLSSGHLRPEAT